MALSQVWVAEETTPPGVALAGALRHGDGRRRGTDLGLRSGRPAAA
jgi:hypothetical protein